MILPIALLALLQLPADAPIRVGNAKVDAQDLSVTYEFVNSASDVTAYEVAITRHFADGSVVVSTQGQDWFSSIGYGTIRAVAVTEFDGWLPPYSAASPGIHLHRFTAPAARTAYLLDAEVTLTAVIRRDGTSSGDPKVLERLWSERHAMLNEYAYWIPRLERARRTLAPLDALSWAVTALATPRKGEVLAGPRDALRYAAKEMSAVSAPQPSDAARLYDAILSCAAQEYRFLGEQLAARQ